MLSLRGGVSWVASARQRKVSLPVPHSLILDISWSRRAGVSVTFPVPNLKYWHRSITLSGAPCGEEFNWHRTGNQQGQQMEVIKSASVRVCVIALFIHALTNILLWEPGLTGVQ